MRKSVVSAGMILLGVAFGGVLLRGSIWPQTVFPDSVFDPQPLLDLSQTTSLLTARTSAVPGSLVTFKARIGGSVRPFHAQVAQFMVMDLSIPYCGEMDGVPCPNPWDYCCVPKEERAAASALVELRSPSNPSDPDAKPLEDWRGLSSLAVVIVHGQVIANVSGEPLRILATHITVAQPPPEEGTESESDDSPE